MKIYQIVAMAKNRVIGKDNKLPWHFPADLKHFRKLTTGSTIIMGRKTYESIGKPLPNRENFVLSRSPEPNQEHLRYFQTIEDAIRNIKTEKAFIIGGATIYQQTMSLVTGIYLTVIEADYRGDVYYPIVPCDFKEVSSINLQDNPRIKVIYYEK